MVIRSTAESLKVRSRSSRWLRSSLAAAGGCPAWSMSCTKRLVKETLENELYLLRDALIWRPFAVYLLPTRRVCARCDFKVADGGAWASTRLNCVRHDGYMCVVDGCVLWSCMPRRIGRSEVENRL